MALRAPEGEMTMTVMTPITPERWRQVYAAFSAVLDQEPAHRAVYLARAFGDDAVLRDEVKRLISDAETAESQGLLQAPAWIIDDIPFRLPDFRNGNSEYSQIEYIGHGGATCLRNRLRRRRSPPSVTFTG